MSMMSEFNSTTAALEVLMSSLLTNPPYYYSVATTLLSMVLVYLVVTKLFLWITTKRRKPVQFFDRTSRKFEQLRRASFPPPYPNGWWKVCDVSDLNHGRIQTVSALGQELVVFRGEDGSIGVLDAFCPHIGAHLGIDGKVVGNTISCPYHGWKFDATGKCIEIPYCTGTIPASAKAKSWPSCVWLDMVFVWFDAEGRPPSYQLMQHSYLKDDSYRLFWTRQSWFDMHVSEMAENSPDYFHFNYLHRTLPIPFIGKYFIVKHETQLYFPQSPTDNNNNEDKDGEDNNNNNNNRYVLKHRTKSEY